MNLTQHVLLIEGVSRPWHRLLNPFGHIFAYRKGVPEHLLNTNDVVMADRLADELIGELYGSLVRPNVSKAFDSILVDPRGHLFLKKLILLKLKEMLLSFVFARKAQKVCRIASSIIFIPKQFNAELYEALSGKLVTEFPQVRISVCCLVMNKVKAMVRGWFRKILIKFFAQIKFVRLITNRSKNGLRRAYKCGVYLRPTDPGFSNMPNSMDFLIAQGIFAREDVLFVIDGSLGSVEAERLTALKRLGYDYCYFKEMLGNYSAREFLKIGYRQLIKAQKQIKGIGLGKTLISEAFLSLFKCIYLWEMFYSKTKVGTFIAIQEPSHVARPLWQKQHGSKNVFMYLSSTHLRDLPVNTYYSRLIFDQFVSSMIPIDEFKGHENHIGEYVDVGILNADHICRIREDKALVSNIRSGLKIPNNMIIISVFDDNSDSYDLISISDILRYMQSLLDLIKDNPNYFYLFKPRSSSVFNRSPELKDAFKRLIENERCLFIQNSGILISSYEIMAVSDLVITVYSSSTLAEALSAGIKTICYKPKDRQYDGFWGMLNQMPQFCFHDKAGLAKNASFWLSESADKAFNNLEQQYVKNKIDSYSDGKAFSRLKKVLLT